jgi:membrane fusion protein
MSDLFRKEVLEHQNKKLDGVVTIATHMSFTWVLGLILGIVIIGFTYLVLGEYHRKEVVSGYLRPTTGLSKIYPLTTGVIDEVFVEEGQIVEKGQLLARIRMERLLTSGSDVNDVIVSQLIKQKQFINENLETQKSLAGVSVEKLESQIASTTFQVEQAQKQLALLSKRVVLSKKRVADTELLIKKQFASNADLETVKDNYFAIQQQAEDLEARLLSQQELLSQYRFELIQMPMNQREVESQLRSQLANINQQISQAESQGSYDVRSQRSGRISNLLVKPGMMAQSNYPLMAVLPEDTQLEAVLFVPTRAYGFVQKGQGTRIRYQAFPYQRFGIYGGVIKSVSKSILLPNETTLPVSLQEPMYQVVVELTNQNAQAYGTSVSLQAGMLLEADIMVDSRSLFEWLFEPIYSIKGAV